MTVTATAYASEEYASATADFLESEEFSFFSQKGDLLIHSIYVVRNKKQW